MYWFSPAKVNLSLHITGKRNDGYHELCTLMQTVGLGDFLIIEQSDEDRLVCSDPEIPSDGRNLVWKAVEAFRKQTGWKAPLNISLDKHIPFEAGLGGGSGNAATTLWAMNLMSGAGLRVDELMAIGASIGSDVPFFFSFGSAICRGRGELVENLVESPMKEEITIVKPPYGLGAGAVYGEVKSYSSALTPILYHNDLEEPAFRIEPRLKELKSTLEGCGFDHVMMSGSGTSFVCVGGGEVESDVGQVFRLKPIMRSKNEWYSLQEMGFHATV